MQGLHAIMTLQATLSRTEQSAVSAVGDAGRVLGSTLSDEVGPRRSECLRELAVIELFRVGLQTRWPLIEGCKQETASKTTRKRRKNRQSLVYSIQRFVMIRLLQTRGTPIFTPEH